MFRKTSFYKLRRFTLRPRIIRDAQMDAVGNGWVIEEEKNINGIGVGVDEHGFSINLERTRKGLTGIGHETVGHLEAVNVRLMFLKTANRIAGGVCRETEKGDEQEQSGKRRPVIESPNPPGRAETCKQPANGYESQIEENEKHGGKEQEAFPDVAEYVV